MDSSHLSRSLRRARRAAPSAESLEGRRLLSTAGAERPGLELRAERLEMRLDRLHGSAAGDATPSTATPAAISAASTPSTSGAPGASTTGAATTPTAGGYGMAGRFASRRGLERGGMAGMAGGMTASQGVAAVSMMPMQVQGFAGGMGMGGGMGMWGGSGGSTASTTSTNPTVTALQQYQTDVKTIYDQSQVTPALQSALTNDLQAISKAATTAPSQSAVLALQSDIQTIGGNLPTSAQLTTLQADFTAAVNSEGVTDTAEINQTFSDLNALITATNITPANITTLTNDLKAAGLSTNDPLLPPLGVNLGVLDQAINWNAGSTTSTAAASTSSSTSTSTASSTS